MNKITTRKAINMIKKSEGKIFTATFVKKDGEVRALNCRTGVWSYLKGQSSRNYNPADYGLVSVFDVKICQYRTVNIKTLKRLAYKGKVYKVVSK